MTLKRYTIYIRKQSDQSTPWFQKVFLFINKKIKRYRLIHTWQNSTCLPSWWYYIYLFVFYGSNCKSGSNKTRTTPLYFFRHYAQYLYKIRGVSLCVFLFSHMCYTTAVICRFSCFQFCSFTTIGRFPSLITSVSFGHSSPST